MEKKGGTVSIAYESGIQVLYFNLAGQNYLPSLESSGATMGMVVDALIENPGVMRIDYCSLD